MPRSNSRTKKTSGKGSEEPGILSRLGSMIKGDEGPREENEPEGPMKATELLKKDHDQVRNLFKRYDDAKGAARAQIVETVSRELTVHAHIEEEIFYPAVQKAGEDDAVKMVRESLEEHQIVKTLIAELAKLSPSDPQSEAKFTVLREAVEHHADEEEDDLFPDAERDLGDDRLMQLGAEMQDRKEELRESPEKGGVRKARPAPARRPAAKSSSRKVSGRPRP